MKYNYEIFDAHCDTLCRICDSGGDITSNTYNVDIARMRQYKSYTQVFACFISPQYHCAPKDRFEKLFKVYGKQNFRGITPILSVEGGEVIESTEDVDWLYGCGVRAVGLTWNKTNRIGGGADDTKSGLTEFGKSVVLRMSEVGILTDVSHLNDRTFYDVAEICTLPLVATHSNSRTVCNSPRNITDEMFGIIRDSGGVVGINLYPPFVNGTDDCTIDDILRHIDRFLNLDGTTSVGLGTDFDGTDGVLPHEVDGVGKIYKLLDAIVRECGEDIAENISHRNFKCVFGR